MALSREESEMPTRVGKGTPGGEMLRRYWHPVGFSNELKNRPVKRRLLGESLVLFRRYGCALEVYWQYSDHVHWNECE